MLFSGYGRTNVIVVVCVAGFRGSACVRRLHEPVPRQLGYQFNSIERELCMVLKEQKTSAVKMGRNAPELSS